ncbi:unnamed protein product, partial [Sphacelaria rigidula]
MPSAGGQPWRQVTLGTEQGSSAGVVPVDRKAECLRADLALPRSVGSFMARVILDSGSALTSIGVGLLEYMSSQFGGTQLKNPFENGPQTAQTATGAPVTVTHKAVPITVGVCTPWGAVQSQPITFAVMSGRDNVVVFGMATMKERCVDRGWECFINPAEERGSRKYALEDSVRQTEQKGLSADDSHC